jgi:cyclase
MLAIRIIPCLDVHGGSVTRGIQFGKAESGELKSVGDPVELAMRYNEQGADEMVFYDITASAHERGTMVDVIRGGRTLFQALTVGAVSQRGGYAQTSHAGAIKSDQFFRRGGSGFDRRCRKVWFSVYCGFD